MGYDEYWNECSMGNTQSVHACSVIQSCLTLCDHKDWCPSGSSVHEFSRQEYWSGLPLPTAGNLPNPGIEPVSPELAGGFFTTEALEKPVY